MLNSFAVGGGTSGSVLATRLSEEPDSVLLIEAGRSDLANDNIPIPAYYGNTQLSKDDWNYFSVAQTRTGLAMKGRVFKLCYIIKRKENIPHCRNSSKIQWKKSQIEAKSIHLTHKYMTVY